MASRQLNGLAILGTAVATLLPFATQASQNDDRCNNTPPVTTELQIAGCTAVIKASAGNAATQSAAFANRGASHAEHGDLTQAISDYGEAIRLNPGYADAYNNRGNAHAALGDHARATADYGEAIRINPRHARAYYNRGIAHQQFRDFTRAIADFNEAARLDPQNHAILIARGDAYGKMEDYPKALVDFTTAIRLASDASKPVRAGLAVRRGFILLAQEDPDRAYVDFQFAITNNPRDALAWHGRAAALIGRRNWQAAYDDLSEAIRLDPAFADSWYLRCMTRAMLGQRGDEVWVDCSEGLRREKGRGFGALGFEATGIAALKLGDWKMALLQFDRGLLLHEDNGRLRYGRGLARIKLGQRSDGQADLTEATQNNPRVAPGFAHYGLVP